MHTLMETAGRSTAGSLIRHSRRSRSQRDRALRRRTTAATGVAAEATVHRRVSSPSPSASSPEAHSTHHRHPRRRRPPRRRRRHSQCCEEDIIDGFAIASFVSLEALETDSSRKPSEHGALMGRGSKRKRVSEENGSRAVSGPEDAEHSRFPQKKSHKGETSGSFALETGYICDTESESGDKASDVDMDPIFTVSTRKVLESLSLSSPSAGKSSTAVHRHPWLSVTPRVSGLQRSQEKSMESFLPDPLAPATHNGETNPGSPRPKDKPFLFYPAPHSLMNHRTSTLSKPPASLAVSSSTSMRLSTPSASAASSSHGTLHPPICLSSSPGLPPPPPLLQANSQRSANNAASSSNAPLPEADLQQERVVGSQPVDDESTTGTRAARAKGGAGSSSTPGHTSAAASQPAIQPLAFQFHQHNHQHQHTHTHQHFTPFLPPTAAPPPLFDKYPGKMEGLYRHPFFSQYPPTVSGIPSMLPPTGPFSSLQGAFQPKGTDPEMSTRLGPIPHHMQHKDPRLSDPFRTSRKVNNKPGKWCAMHVRVAWMIYRHQEKVKADHPKLDYCSDMLARLPGAASLSGIGGLAGLTPGLASAHELTRPSSIFTASGGVLPASSPFGPPATPHSFLTPTSHIDPFGRPLPFASLGALGTSAFGGLGSPTLVASSVFGPKDTPGRAVGALATSSHDSWKRLHRPPAFPTPPSWAQGIDKKDEREMMKETDKREIIHIKDEKDRDCSVYGRRPVGMSPHTQSSKHSSSTPISHTTSSERTVGEAEGPFESEVPRARSGEGRQTSVLPSRAVGTDRPCSSSSSSSAPPTPAPTRLASPLDLYPHPQRPKPQAETSRATPLVPSLSQDKKSGAAGTSTKASNLPPPAPPPLLMPPVKVKEERKEELEPVPISIPPPQLPHHGFERPSHLSLGPSSRIPLPSPGPHPHHLSLSLPSRALLGGPAGTADLLVGPAGEGFSAFPHIPPPPQGPPAPWDPWREQHREALALRSEPHLARFLQHQQAQRLFDAERAAAIAAATSHHHQHHAPDHRPGPGGTLLDEERAQILREDFERARYYGMHPSRAAHLDPLYTGLLSHPHQPGVPVSSSAPVSSPHHPALYSHLGPMHPSRHLANGLLHKTAVGLVGPLSVGAPPPLIPSVTPNRASMSPRSARLGPPPELALYSTHKDRESR